MKNDYRRDFEQVSEWVAEYKKCKISEQKKKLLTLIVITCIPLVKNIAYNLARRSTDPVEDIVQVGSIGLIKGVQNYDAEKGNIKSYLTTFIVGEIKHYLRDKAQVIKPPREILELSYRISKLNPEDFDGDACKENIAKKLKTSKAKVEEAFDFDRRHLISLDQIQFPNDDDFKTYGENLADEKINLEEDVNKILLNDAIEQLPEKLKFIIKSIYYDNVYQSELAKIMNTPQSNISRMQKRALKMLFDIITKEKVED